MKSNYSGPPQLLSDMDSSQKILDILCESTKMRFGFIRRKTDDIWESWCTYDHGSKKLATESNQNYIEVYKVIRNGSAPVFIPDVEQCENVHWQKLLRSLGLGSYISFLIMGKDGTIVGHLSFMNPWSVQLDSTKLTALLPTYSDLIALDFLAVTKIRNTEKALRGEREYSRNRDIVLSSLAHDLNNPLSAVNMLSKYLGDRIVDKRQKDMAKRITESSLRMKHMINDILDFSTLKMGGGLTCTTEPVCIASLIRQVLNEFNPALSLLVNTDVNLQAPVICNKSKMGRAMANLLGNALKHGKSGKKIQVKAFTLDNKFVFSVENETNPICPTVLVDLFVPFVRGKGSSGLGLGLYITREIARMHNGDIDVKVTKRKIAINLVIPLAV